MPLSLEGERLMKKFLFIAKYVFLVILLLLYTGLYIFVQQHNYQSADTIFHYTASLVVCSISVIVFYYIFIDYWRVLLEPKIRYANLLVISQVLLFLLLILFQSKFPENGLWLDSKVIYIFGEKLPKKYLFDLVVIILFPALSSMVLASVKETASLAIKLTSAGEILLLTIIGYFLFYGLGYVWLVNMAVLNTVTISAGMYQIPAFAGKRNGSRIACMILYVLFHVILLTGLKKGTTGLACLLYQGNWCDYQECVGILMKNANLCGQNRGLTIMSAVQEALLYGHGNFIHSLLYYFGWISVFVYIVTLAIFFGCLFQFLHPERKEEDSLYAVYLAAFWNLVLRAVGGILYSFAIVPFPISLPFAGKVGFVADMCCVVLLLYNHVEGIMAEVYLSLYEEE